MFILTYDINVIKCTGIEHSSLQQFILKFLHLIPTTTPTTDTTTGNSSWTRHCSQ